MPARVPYHRMPGWELARRAYAQGEARQAANRFYASKRWLRLRDLVRAGEPLCRECLKEGRVEPTTQVDHVIPRGRRPDLELDRDNLQGLCDRCHASKTRAGE